MLLRIGWNAGKYQAKCKRKALPTTPDIETATGAIHCVAPNCRNDWRGPADQNLQQPLESGSKKPFIPYRALVAT